MNHQMSKYVLQLIEDDLENIQKRLDEEKAYCKYYRGYKVYFTKYYDEKIKKMMYEIMPINWKEAVIAQKETLQECIDELKNK